MSMSLSLSLSKELRYTYWVIQQLLLSEEDRTG